MLSLIFLVLVHWNNSLWVDVPSLWHIILIPSHTETTVCGYMSLHSDTLSWFQAKQQSVGRRPFTLSHYPDSKPNNSLWVYVPSLWHIILIPSQTSLWVDVPSLLTHYPASKPNNSLWVDVPSLLTHYPDSKPNNSLWVDVPALWHIILIPGWMSLHSDTLSWFWAKQSLLLLLYTASFAEKQQISIL
jgi:hypothetical protein